MVPPGIAALRTQIEWTEIDDSGRHLHRSDYDGRRAVTLRDAGRSGDDLASTERSPERSSTGAQRIICRLRVGRLAKAFSPVARRVRSEVGRMIGHQTQRAFVQRRRKLTGCAQCRRRWAGNTAPNVRKMILKSVHIVCSLTYLIRSSILASQTFSKYIASGSPPERSVPRSTNSRDA